ncbi:MULTISPECIES: EF-hand domain-containing protein [Kitasatospora]|uniref:EF-hand domain-containing protein n=1 Tax=Kitasatospora TaxID=2063 RepID=UPI0004C1D761|nr:MULTISPECIES: EF-hand domain-containing protein [Kitasatospora]
MANEFQRRKLRNVFAAFDTDGDGCLRKNDFEALAERWGRLPAVQRDAALGVRVEALMLGWWDHLLTVADSNHDGRVDMEEFLTLVDRLPALREVVTATADTVFDAVDENGDGRISRAEHARLVDIWHGRTVPTDDVFDLIDLDGDGYLSRPEFALLWEQFWISADPSDPGNAMCGRIPEQ